MDKYQEEKEELQKMVDAGIVSFSRLATFVDGPYSNQQRDVEQYFKYITVTAMDPADLGKDDPIQVKTGDYQLIEGSNGKYKWMGCE